VTGTVLAGPVVRAIQDNKVSPGVLGFLIVAALGVATYFLIRSMNRQLHKIDFSEDAIDRERRTARVPEVEQSAQVDGPQAKDSAEPEADGDDDPGVAGDRVTE
jgi:hypothetical protein